MSSHPSQLTKAGAAGIQTQWVEGEILPYLTGVVGSRVRQSGHSGGREILSHSGGEEIASHSGSRLGVKESLSRLGAGEIPTCSGRPLCPR